MIINVVRFILIVLEVVTALLLIGVILLQRTKSQGMGLAFGSGMGESLFGAQVGNVITRITVILAIVFLVNTTLMALLQTGGVEQSVTDTVVPAPAMPTMPAGQPPLGAGGMPTPPVGGDMPAPAGMPVELPEAAAPVAPAVDTTPAAPAVDVPETAVDVPSAPAVETPAAPETDAAKPE